MHVQIQEKKINTEFWPGNQKGGNHFRYLSVGERIIL